MLRHIKDIYFYAVTNFSVPFFLVENLLTHSFSVSFIVVQAFATKAPRATFFQTALT